MTTMSAQLIVGTDQEKVRITLSRMLAAEGVVVEVKDIPHSQVGDPNQLRSHFMFYEDEQHIIVLGMNDATLHAQGEGGRNDDVCGLDWLIAKRGKHSYTVQKYLSDPLDAFGEKAAFGSFKEALGMSRKDMTGIRAVFSTLLDLYKEGHIQSDRIRNSLRQYLGIPR
jgi:hypothetical protein